MLCHFVLALFWYHRLLFLLGAASVIIIGQSSRHMIQEWLLIGYTELQYCLSRQTRILIFNI